MMTTGQIKPRVRGQKKKLERQLQADDIIPYLTEMGAYVEKIHVGTFQKKGVPDIRCCYLGRYIAFELKIAETVEEKKIQNYRMRKIIQAGGIAKKVASLREVEEVLHEVSRVQSDRQSE
jgi:penicillin-binding protein-related factor A (putative recombinase)